MLRNRPSTSTTLFACTVVNTRCPVSADWTAMLAVSSSRISPTMIVSENRAKAPREGQPLLLVDRDLRDAGKLILDGILDRDDLVLVIANLGERRVERRRLSRARGARHEDHPVRLGDEFPEPLEISLGEADHVEG